MASKTVVELFDDLDGGRADETVVFALDGVEYEIDLSKSNATALRDVLAAYIAHGHRVTGRSRSVTRTAAAVVAEKPEKPAKGKPKSATNSNASMTAEIRRLASESARKVSQAKVVEVVDDDDEPDLFSTEPGVVVEERGGTTEVGPVPALIIPFQEASL